MSQRTKKLIRRTLKVLIAFYLVLCLLMYYFQERFIFLPEKLSKDFKFEFTQPFKEINVQTENGKLLNGLLFTADSSKGLIFYLHGNAGSLENWGSVAKTYTDLHYDIFIPDYPGYGKSEGIIKSENQLFSDIQIVYNKLKQTYNEDSIIIIGYSIGTGLAAKLASDNHPKQLILQAPYYSLTDMMKHTYPVLPTFLLKYKFETAKYLKKCRMPLVIFHGNTDQVIYYGSSLKLQKEFKSTDTLITLDGQGHNGMTGNPDYLHALQKVLK